MKTKVSPAAVGVFVLGAFALGLIALLSFGGMSLFSKPHRFTVYFDESIHGLDLGSPVKLRGVRVGRVVDLAVHYDDVVKHSVVVVVCELNRNVITDEKGADLKIAGEADIQQMVDDGLRAQLGVLGLATGLLFVELDFEDPALYPPPKLRAPARYVVIPAMPSAISEYQESLSEILADLKKVDFAGISREAKTLLTTANQKVGEADVKGLADKVGRAADSVTAFVESPAAQQAFAQLNETLAATKAAIERIDTQVGPVSDELKQTLAAAQTALKTLESTAATTRRFVQRQGDVGDELTTALRQVADAAGALETLANALERNPSSLLVGKKKKSE
ncbi:Paraquat-inducible protein B [Lacunisphaera limnophila]|uniref:Paraquat-inducible protein B n=1 Tax=Lacunisphaera limnophila TaxID=1838286 RepID=A0A1D8ARU2_9BACT|nr:MlaD family protein [Lacunisphaera limnophila]AOS43613.1 Paraquat-inducible protein B [Lacunisphaera limnophila]